MLKIGRYGIALGPVLWFQTKVPTRVWNFLWFWFIKEDRPTLPTVTSQAASSVEATTATLTGYISGPTMEQEGRRFRYWKAGEDVSKGGV